MDKQAEATSHIPGSNRGRGINRVLLIAAPVLGMASLCAHSQTLPAPDSAPIESASVNEDEVTQPKSLETVTVTATRRREPIREVPLAVSTISTDALQEAGAKDLGDYLMSQPGVNYAKNGQAGRGDINIRGVTTGAQSTATVGIYVDDVPIGSSSSFADGVSAYDQRLLDLSHIEVLKGPQGTLYGASAMGGLLKFVTVEPETDTLSGKVGIDLSSTKNGKLNTTMNGVVNVPLKQDSAAIRVSLFNTEDAGYVDATGPAADDRANRGDARGGRIALLLTPTENLRIKLSAQGQNTSTDGKSFVDYGLNTNTPIVGDLTREGLVYAEPQTINNRLYVATFEYDMGWARASSITAKQTSRYASIGDYSAVYSLFPFGIVTSFSDLRTDVDKWTQEFRLVSQTSGDFEWLAGGFLTKEDSKIGQEIYQTTAGNPDPYANPLLYGPDLGYASTYKEYAVYGTGTWNVTTRFALTAGVRAAHNKQDVIQSDFGLFTSNSNSTGEASESPTTYLLAGKYKLTPTSNVYARAASGYRAGGPNLALVDPITHQPLTAEPGYESDSLWSYEVGYKADLLDNTASVEVAAYDIEWSNIQQVGSKNGAAFRTNAGNARIKGIELGGSIRPMTGLSLGASVSFIDAKLTEDALNGLQASAGARLPNSARFSGALNGRYNFMVAGRYAFVGATVTHVGQRNAAFVESTFRPNHSLPAFTQADMSAGMSFSSIDVGVYVRNAFDSRGQLQAATDQAGVGGPNFVTTTRPRTIGVTVSASF